MNIKTLQKEARFVPITTEPGQVIQDKMLYRIPNEGKCFRRTVVPFRKARAFTIVTRIPTAKLKIPGKSIFKTRNQNFYYIQVIVFDFSYRPVAAIGT